MRQSSAKPLLSILIPHHGRSIDDLSKLLSGLDRKMQKGLRIEIIVCLNKNFDLGVIENFDIVKIHMGSINSTAGEKRNLLLDNAKGKFIWFLDADDVLYTDTLERLCSILEESRSDLVLTNFTTVNFLKEIVDVSRLPVGIDKTKQYSFLTLCQEQPKSGVQYLEKIMPWANAVYRQIISRAFLDQHKINFSSRLIGEDHEFSLDVLSANPNIGFFASITYQHILHPSSISNSHSKFLLNELVVSLNQIKQKISRLPESAFKSALDNYYLSIMHIAPYIKLHTFTLETFKMLGTKRGAQIVHFKVYGKLKYEIKKIAKILRMHYYTRLFAKFRNLLQRFLHSSPPHVGAQLSGYHPLGSGAASQRIITGDNVFCDMNISFETGLGFLRIGENSSIGSGTIIISQEAGIRIGKNCLISWNVLITDSDTHLTNPTRISDARDWNIGIRTGRRGEYKEWAGVKSSPVIIGDNVWIGYGAVILPGVQIGDNAIIGASSVVTRDVPAGATVAGNPSRLISEGKRA
jgi:acetyltransferase-like isoleucine patch superfamily enzyme